ncbi:aminoglycoside phosphotransferase family protein [Terribacillus saccharophilus]|uniref:aminoglycoside phosphotransferase family protein n=1 Tax=Terribacillus saccharophilus TaxID=361277 RepID=UPI002DC7F9C5|nr:aminoglycoside phosphotransferase family protein [Terribacillus saccharophilus]MEC0290822.1 aminoglycoside phosphotransferase family protein [Terribacillus saccharophilus]
MDKHLMESISHLSNAKEIVELKKGYSNDQKYVIDQKYLLRIFPMEEAAKRQNEFISLNRLYELSKYVPKGLEFGDIDDLQKAYMVLTFLPGIDAEEGLSKLTEVQQYAAGVSAGSELKKLHTLSAPLDQPAWEHVKVEKINNYMLEFKELDIDQNIMEFLQMYIESNLYLMKDRPNKFQHDDFHPSNLLIHNNSFSGIIDFQRMDWGDPIHDLQKLGFFSKQVSIEFTKGILDGYHDGQFIEDTFWKLYSFYSAVHIVSALVWGKKRSQSQFDLLLNYSFDVLKDHENFRCIIPNWYSRN